jgi:hypothetical protein
LPQIGLELGNSKSMVQPITLLAKSNGRPFRKNSIELNTFHIFNFIIRKYISIIDIFIVLNKGIGNLIIYVCISTYIN